MFDVGGGELLFILLAIVLLFGPKKLPELAKSFGKGMAQLRKAQTEFQRNLNSLQEEIESTVNEPVQQVRSLLEEGDDLPSAREDKPVNDGVMPLGEYTDASASAIDSMNIVQSEALPEVQHLTPIRIQPAEGAIARNAAATQNDNNDIPSSKNPA